MTIQEIKAEKAQALLDAQEGWATKEQQMFNEGIIKAKSHDGLDAKAWWYSLPLVAQKILHYFVF